jgi:glutathione S-transferase
MRLFEGALPPPSARRVTVYLAEKGIEIERVKLDLQAKEQKAPEFLAKNSIGRVPVLELDDGTYLPESSAIVEYLEEKFPQPTMLGETREERAHARATERIVGEIYPRLGLALMHTHPGVPERRPGFVQVPEIARVLQPAADELLDQLEVRMRDHAFLCGARPTIADCSFYALMEMVYPVVDYELPERCPRLRRWHGNFRLRRSAQS